MITPTFRARAASPVVWSPGERAPPPPVAPHSVAPPPPPPPAPVWTPRSAGPSPPTPRHNFRPVAFNSPPTVRRYPTAPEPKDTPQKIILNGESSPRSASGLLLPTASSRSAPAGIDTLGACAPAGPVRRTAAPPPPPPPPAPNAAYQQRLSNPNLARVDNNWKVPAITTDTKREESGWKGVGVGRDMLEDGVGPTTKDGMPVALRSEVKDPSKWYKKMYDTIHKNKYDDDYVTVRYKNPRGSGASESGTLSRPSSNRSQYAYFDARSGYLSEPEHGRANTAPRRRPAANVAANPHASQNHASAYMPTNKFSTLASARAQQEVYRNQPGRIEDYVPGRSSVIDKEAKKWWDEVMDIFDGWRDENSPLPQYSTLLAGAIHKSQLSNSTSLHSPAPREKKNVTAEILSKSNMARALKESGYESDSTLVFRRRAVGPGAGGEEQLSPRERRSAYRDLQAGGEPPHSGFRTPAPERPRDDSEIEYFPLSPTLTRIRVHRNGKVSDMEPGKVFGKDKTTALSFVNLESTKERTITFLPPAPPRRLSSKDNNTLKLVSSVRSTTKSHRREKNDDILNISNVSYLKDKISEKLTRKEARQTSQIYREGRMKSLSDAAARTRQNSSSAPPSVNRIKTTSSTHKGTSSFSSPRRTISPTQYSHSTHSRYNKFASDIRVPIEGGAGRRMPITAILDKATCLDKTLNLEKRIPLEIRKRASRSTESLPTKEIKRANLVKLPKSNKPTSKSSDTIHLSISSSDTSISKTARDRSSKLNIHPSSKGRDVKGRTAAGVKPSANSLGGSTSMINLSKSRDFSTSTYKSKNRRVAKNDLTKPTDTRKIPVVITVRNDKMKADDNNNYKMMKGSSPSMDPMPKAKKQSKTEKNEMFADTTVDGCAKKSSNDHNSNTSHRNELHVSEFGSELYVIGDGKVKPDSNDIYAQRDAIDTNSFFQHLFLRDASPALSTNTIMTYYSTSVLEKAKLFQSVPQYFLNRSINSYLAHKKPVSQSKFRKLDKIPRPEGKKSPRSVSWPGRMTDNAIRKFESITPMNRDSDEEFGSNCSISTVRSRSVESPRCKVNHSQTSQLKSQGVLPRTKNYSADINNFAEKISVPPKIIFSQTCRPVTLIIKPKMNHKKDFSSPRSSPSKIVFSQTSRPVSPVVFHNKKSVRLSRSLSPAKINTETRKNDERVPKIILTQTSRPVSPALYRRSKHCSEQNISRSHSPSPSSIRSPSHRKIHSARVMSNSKKCPQTHYPKKMVIRTRSAGEADTNHSRNDSGIIRSNSSENVYSPKDLDHYEYVSETQSDEKSRSERFRELNRYYSLLERVGELEKAISHSDLRHRRRDEEIIDYERWKKIRSIERAEEELDRLYYKLRLAQDEDDVLFYPRDVNDFRWNHNKDRGLRIKEKSVEDLRGHFQSYDNNSHASNRYDWPANDIYKPLWRGTSVASAASSLNSNKVYEDETIQVTSNRPKNICTNSSLSDLRKRLGLGSRLWSSLSMEQVNVLKNQLNAIYSKDPETKVKPKSKESENYVITVPMTIPAGSDTQLYVRRNSLTTGTVTKHHHEEDFRKSDSISAMNVPPSVKQIKNEYNAKCQMALSETEKRKISQTLSREVLDRVKRVSDYETRGAPAAAQVHANTPEFATPPLANDESTIPAKICVADANNNGEFSHQPVATYSLHPSSASETETCSSDKSNKTVIYRGPSELKKKVEYFEKAKYENEKGATIHHAREHSLEEEKSHELRRATESKTNVISYRGSCPQHKYNSQSCANFKELFGETEKNRYYSSLPIKSTSHVSRSPSPKPDSMCFNSLATTQYSSTDSLGRSRSLSPDPERYWRAYLSLMKAGDVRRLKRRFESISPSTSPSLRRYRSDPEIARSTLKLNWDQIKAVALKRYECGDVDKLTHKYELFGRERNRFRRGGVVSPVPKVPSRQVDRLMPHIDVISKLASLTRRTVASASVPRYTTDYPLECPVGEVGRIRQQFENMSPLGQIFTSTPDVRELRDIAPYLAGPWTAHKFPKRSDNNRSIEGSKYMTEDLYAPVRKDRRRPKSTSPGRGNGVKLSSILKPNSQVRSTALSEQPFDPTLHRPVSRYQPPPPLPPAPHLVRTGTSTVSFREPDWAPEPPPKGLPIGSTSHGAESPRRYVESDVNIHYRVPVRQEPRPALPEHELAERQADHMRRLYQEERRRKYLQDYGTDMTDAFDLCTKELQDMQSRRHTDNFTPSQKSAVPLDRYDSLEVSGGAVARGGTRVRARALYAFTSQSPRELTFRKNEIITVRRQVDANWYEGELAGKVGLFPYNYVEILQGEEVDQRNGSSDTSTLRGMRPADGKARAKFDFVAQTNLELPLRRGELVALVRRVDDNWWEGRRGDRTGIFPHTYVQVLATPVTPTAEVKTPSDKSLTLANGSAQRSSTPASQTLPKYRAAPATATLPPAPAPAAPLTPAVDLNNREPLYVDTNAEAVPYRAMYKYRPQNPDELELAEGDTVYVLEQCDDGWYVGSSQRTGRLGTFPGNYVRRI